VIGFFYPSMQPITWSHRRNSMQKPNMKLFRMKWPPLWSSGQSSWLQIQRPRFDSRCYQIFWEIVGLKRGLISLMSTIEELVERKSSGSGLESPEHGRRDPWRWPRKNLYPQMLAVTSPTSGVLSVSVVSSRTKATEFNIMFLQST
jgi:hypothetical protein